MRCDATRRTYNEMAVPIDPDCESLTLSPSETLPPSQPKNSSIHINQFRKLEELRKRRLQIRDENASLCKKSSAVQGKSVRLRTSQKQNVKSTDHSETTTEVVNNRARHVYETGTGHGLDPFEECYVLPNTWKESSTVQKKRQKLQWGLATKERWERKGNM